MKKAPIILAGLFLLAGGIGYFFTWSTYQDWQKAGQQLDTVAEELDSLKDRRTLLGQLEAAQPGLGQQARIAEQLIPTDENRESFISEVDGLATTHNVKIQTLTFSATSSAPTKKSSADDEEEKASSKSTTKKAANTRNKTIEFRLTTTGQYLESLRFLDQLERSDRYASVSTIDVAPSSDGQVSLSLTGYIYTRPAPKASNSAKFDPTVWNYLSQRQTPLSPTLPAGNRTSPFGASNN